MTKAKKPSMADTANKLGDDLFELGRGIWLFGMGTVATCEDGVRGTVDRMVTRGEHCVEDLRGERETVIAKVTGRVQELGTAVEDRFQNVMTGALRRAGVPSAGEIQILIERVEDLTAKVDTLGAKH